MCRSAGLLSGERGQYLFRARYPTENSALSFDHVQTHLLKLREIGPDAVLEHEAVVPAVVSLPHRGVHAYFGGDTCDAELADPAILQNRMKVCRKERALAGLVNDGFSGNRIKFGDDVVSGFTPHENAAHGARIADLFVATTPKFLSRRKITEIGTMSFACVYHGEFSAPPCSEQ